MSMKGSLQHLLVNFVPLRNCFEQEGYFFDFLLQDIGTRVESGLDDPDYLGHLGNFFGGSSRSHPQTKLSGCDLDF